ncbi:GNAT family N-acetyltransferase [Bradyrhizobium sp. AUGA SZCCT0160]|uniref:GNAT family N-acetyltransferase n=1 Tax=Bradyrhizobium sp. AUGA SZCCT0160 TaxID=2807662 RepID=UPI0020122E6F|nr:GNAT family N-acetyltransferase [Bradyrhizobium sp. AUGA SZCCT0160]
MRCRIDKAGTDPQTGQTRAFSSEVDSGSREENASKQDSAVTGATLANIPGLQIRRLQISDAALYRDIRLEALQKNPEAFGSTFGRESAEPLSWFEARLGAADIFAAFLDGTLAGIAGYSAQENLKQAHKGRLWTMYVRAAARNMGLGKSLVAAVLDHARGRVELVQLTVVSENESARKLYRAMGFVEYGYEKQALKHNGRYYDEVLMVNFLDESSS